MDISIGHYFLRRTRIINIANDVVFGLLGASVIVRQIESRRKKKHNMSFAREKKKDKSRFFDVTTYVLTDAVSNFEGFRFRRPAAITDSVHL